MSIQGRSFEMTSILLGLVFQEGIFNCANPLRRVGDLECRRISLVVGVLEVNFDEGLMQVNAFVDFVMVDSGNAGCRYIQFQLFQAAAVKQTIRKQQQESTAFAGISRMGVSREKPYLFATASSCQKISAFL